MITRKYKSNNELKERLGYDLKFPIVNNFESVSGLECLIQDIEQLLLTIPGERVNRPTFGCNLRNQIWENIHTAATDGESSIKVALSNFEPRITVISVTSEVDESKDLIIFNIQFKVNSTDTTVNLVFPFRSGTQLSFK